MSWLTSVHLLDIAAAAVADGGFGGGARGRTSERDHVLRQGDENACHPPCGMILKAHFAASPSAFLYIAGDS